MPTNKREILKVLHGYARTTPPRTVVKFCSSVLLHPACDGEVLRELAWTLHTTGVKQPDSVFLSVLTRLVETAERRLKDAKDEPRLAVKDIETVLWVAAHHKTQGARAPLDILGCLFLMSSADNPRPGSLTADEMHGSTPAMLLEAISSLSYLPSYVRTRVRELRGQARQHPHRSLPYLRDLVESVLRCPKLARDGTPGAAAALVRVLSVLSQLRVECRKQSIEPEYLRVFGDCGARIEHAIAERTWAVKAATGDDLLKLFLALEALPPHSVQQMRHRRDVLMPVLLRKALQVIPEIADLPRLLTATCYVIHGLRMPGSPSEAETLFTAFRGRCVATYAKVMPGQYPDCFVEVYTVLCGDEVPEARRSEVDRVRKGLAAYSAVLQCSAVLGDAVPTQKGKDGASSEALVLRALEGFLCKTAALWSEAQSDVAARVADTAIAFAAYTGRAQMPRSEKQIMESWFTGPALQVVPNLRNAQLTSVTGLLRTIGKRGDFNTAEAVVLRLLDGTDSSVFDSHSLRDVCLAGDALSWYIGKLSSHVNSQVMAVCEAAVRRVARALVSGCEGLLTMPDVCRVWKLMECTEIPQAEKNILYSLLNATVEQFGELPEFHASGTTVAFALKSAAKLRAGSVSALVALAQVQAPTMQSRGFTPLLQSLLALKEYTAACKVLARPDAVPYLSPTDLDTLLMVASSSSNRDMSRKICQLIGEAAAPHASVLSDHFNNSPKRCLCNIINSFCKASVQTETPLLRALCDALHGRRVVRSDGSRSSDLTKHEAASLVTNLRHLSYSTHPAVKYLHAAA
eukprot:Rhum_TRINITY_DN9216_c0_g1::Rhum_TRINITY_DN9216_c0_g1_i1::g.32325::m.32325